METLTHFLIGMLVYGAGPTAIVYIVYHFLGEKGRKFDPPFGMHMKKHHHFMFMPRHKL